MNDESRPISPKTILLSGIFFFVLSIGVYDTTDVPHDPDGVAIYHLFSSVTCTVFTSGSAKLKDDKNIKKHASPERMMRRVVERIRFMRELYHICAYFANISGKQS